LVALWTNYLLDNRVHIFRYSQNFTIAFLADCLDADVARAARGASLLQRFPGQKTFQVEVMSAGGSRIALQMHANGTFFPQPFSRLLASTLLHTFDLQSIH